MANFLLKCFPFPKYLQIPSVGMDISDKTIKFAELENYEGQIRLKNFGKKGIEKGIVERGEIKKPEELIKHLAFFKNELSNKYVSVSLPEEKGFLKVVKLPFMKESQIRKSLTVQIEEIVPLSSEDVVFDFSIISSSVKNNITKVVLSVFPKKLAEDYVLVFEKAGYVPTIFELESQSIMRPLVDPAEKEAVMVVDFGKTRTSFLVGEGGVVKFSSSAVVAGEHIDKVIAKKTNSDISVIEKAKVNYSFNKSGDEEIFSTMLPIVSALKDEARKIIQYWSTHSVNQVFNNREISKIILCGGDAILPGIADYFAYELKKPVEIGNPWCNITSFDKYVPKIKKEESLKYVTALGLAMRSIDSDLCV